MTRSEIYLEAARRVAEKEYCACCTAIDNVRAERAFAKLFRPDHSRGWMYWWDECCCCADESTRGPRVIALCLMAAIAEER